MITYAAYYNNEIRNDCSSGGVAHVIANKFIPNGIVYGVTWDDDYQTTKYVRIVNSNDLYKIRGSKYLQANSGKVFRNVKKDLIANKNVLFFGTACQINGLMLYLQKQYVNLITVDIICHGVPSPKLWNKFIENEKVNYVNFRCKDKGWEKYGLKINDRFISNEDNFFMKLYLQNISLRPSCYGCVCKKNKMSDITIGDFWGIDEVIPEMNDHKGVSVVIIRTEKGKKLWNKISSELVMREVDYYDGVKYNSSEYESVKMPRNRKKFFEDIEKLSVEQLAHKYIKKESVIKKIIRKVKSF